ATLGGNLGTGSPIGDSLPALLSLDARVVLVSLGEGGEPSEREVPLHGYFSGYRLTVRRPDEIIRAVRLPLPLLPLTRFYKVAKRRYDDVSSVSAAFALRLGDGGLVADVRLSLGGVAATPLRALEAEDALRGQPWTLETVRRAARILAGAGTPISDVRASRDYRAAMLEQLLLKFHHELSRELSGEEVGT
ncbi:MAG: FAD binding domain-containing protein, partial [Deinococcus sp.]